MASTRLLQMRRRLGRVRAQAIVDARLMTRRLGSLPDFVIIGAPRSGTTTLWQFLVEHPRVRRAAKKEIHFFDDHYEKGISWYRAHFPRTDGSLTGEASPGYLAHPLAPARMAKEVGEAKFVALLRDPIDRAFSHHQHRHRRGRDPRTFEQAIDDELAGREVEGLRTDTLEFGRYADHFERWLQHFPRSSFLVLDADRFFADPATWYAHTLGFVGLEAVPRASYPNANPAPAGRGIDPGIRARLRDFYREPNARLRDLLGTDFGWG